MRGTHPFRWAAALGTVLLLVAAGSTARPAFTQAQDKAPPSYVVGADVTLDAATESPRAAPKERTPATRSVPASPPTAAGPPTGVTVPSLRIGAPVAGIKMDAAKGLTPPDDPRVVGWWSEGAPAGSARGATLVTGHTVSSGGGAFDDLEHVKPGAAVRVGTAAGALRYQVRSVEVYPKGALAVAAPDLFSQASPHRLVLVTCEDWNGTEYESNVVVVADPAPARASGRRR